jgi:hypothetical protein
MTDEYVGTASAGMQDGDTFTERVDPIIRSDGDFVGTGMITAGLPGDTARKNSTP